MKQHPVALFVGSLVGLLTVASIATADVPHQMHYQGQLTDDLGAPLDTVVSMTFTIYSDSGGGMVLWTETQMGVEVSGGLFNVSLGSVTPMPDSVFADDWRWLGIQIASDPEITPRYRLVTVPYAFRVATVDGALGGTVLGKLHGVTGGSEMSVHGENTTSDNEGYLGGQDFGVYGQNDTDSNRHIGYLGGEEYGVFGEDTLYGTHGFLGGGSVGAAGYQGDGYNDNFALLGYHNAGVYAWSPREDAVFAYTDSGVAVNAVAIRGIAGKFYGSVGINSNNIDGKLDISGPEDTDLIVFETGGTNRFSIQAHSSGTDYLSIRKKFSGDSTIAVFTQDARVGINTTSPSEELHVVGDIYCTGKLTSDGGNDPPYVLYNKETRKAIIKRVADEVPGDKRDGAVLFWNGDTMQFEVYLPEKGEFRDLQGDLLAAISELRGER